MHACWATANAAWQAGYLGRPVTHPADAAMAAAMRLSWQDELVDRGSATEKQSDRRRGPRPSSDENTTMFSRARCELVKGISGSSCCNPRPRTRDMSRIPRPWGRLGKRHSIRGLSPRTWRKPTNLCLVEPRPRRPRSSVCHTERHLRATAASSEPPERLWSYLITAANRSQCGGHPSTASNLAAGVAAWSGQHSDH